LYYNYNKKYFIPGAIQKSGIGNAMPTQHKPIFESRAVYMWLNAKATEVKFLTTDESRGFIAAQTSNILITDYKCQKRDRLI